MKLERLDLQNFRGFESLELSFDPEVTALVGVNGAGKTTILDAVRQLLGVLGTRIVDGGLELADIRGDRRLGADFAESRLTIASPGQTRSWSARTEGELGSLGGDLAGAKRTVFDLNTLLQSGGGVPLLVFYPTRRGAIDLPPPLPRPLPRTVFGDALQGALDGGASNFQAFLDWFREEEDVFNEQVVRGAVGDGRASVLPAVRAAIEQLVPGASDLRVDRRPQRMTVKLGDRRLDVASLSGGQLSLLAMVGDLARRLALLTPSGLNPLDGDAIVLIDEVELHLHPGAQRTVMPTLRRVFPNAQFVISTHSPQVLSSLHQKNVRLLENFQLKNTTRGTWHRDTNNILESAFGDAGRPKAVAAKLNELRDAVDQDEIGKARELLRELRAEVEGEDPELFYLEQLLPPESGDPDAAAVAE
jgi:predicted ATP-binding protein involved in virulence